MTMTSQLSSSSRNPRNGPSLTSNRETQRSVEIKPTKNDAYQPQRVTMTNDDSKHDTELKMMAHQSPHVIKVSNIPIEPPKRRQPAMESKRDQKISYSPASIEDMQPLSTEQDLMRLNFLKMSDSTQLYQLGKTFGDSVEPSVMNRTYNAASYSRNQGKFNETIDFIEAHRARNNCDLDINPQFLRSTELPSRIHHLQADQNREKYARSAALQKAFEYQQKPQMIELENTG